MSDFTELVSKQYKALGAKVRLVVVHPHYSQAHQVLRLAADAHYLSLRGWSLDRAQIQAQYEGLLTASGAQLAARDNLIINEADRAAAGALCDFIRDELLPKVQRGRIIVIGRSVPTALLQDPALTKVTRIIPVDPARMLIDYMRPDGTSDHLLEVRALGCGRVYMDGRLIENWDGNLPRSLFFYLVDRGMVTRNDIFRDFWPNLSTQEATNVFHVTKRKISEVLGTDLTEYHSGFYHLSSKLLLHYDVHVFNHLLQECSIADVDDAIRMMRLAATLYRGSYVPSIKMPWAERRRQEIGYTFGELMALLARSEEQRGEKQAAFSHYMRSSSLTPPRDDVMERILTLSRELGAQADALKIYERFKEAHLQALGMEPPRPLQKQAAALAKTIRR